MGTAQWYFSLQDISGACALGWPAHVYWGDVSWAEPDLGKGPEWLVVTSHDQWDAVAFTWCPLAEQVLCGMRTKAAAEARPHIVAKISHAPRRLLQECAWHAFWKLPQSFLLWACKHKGVDATSKDSLLMTLEKLISACVKVTDDEMMAILALRKVHSEMWSELLALDGAAECVHRADLPDFEKENERAEQRRSAQDAFRSEWRGRKKLWRAAKLAAKAKTVKAKPFHGLKYPKALPDGDIDRAQASLYCPPGWKVYFDKVGGRWQIFNGRITRSRSWLLYGLGDALKRCLVTARTLDVEDEGLDLSDCPVGRLFDKPASSVGESASSSSGV